MHRTEANIKLHDSLMRFLRDSPISVRAIETRLNIPAGRLSRAVSGESTCYKHVNSVLKFIKETCFFDPEKIN